MTSMEKLRLIKTEAIDRAEDHADKEWLSAARVVVRDLALYQQYLTTDDVWREMSSLPVVTHEPRALGAVMREASRERIIANTNRWVRSQRRSCHLRPIVVWRSEIYRR